MSGSIISKVGTPPIEIHRVDEPPVVREEAGVPSFDAPAVTVARRADDGIDAKLGVALEPGAALRFGAVVHHPAIGKLMKPSYDAESLGAVRSLLEKLGTLDITVLASGLPCGGEQVKGADTNAMGYHHVWVRDAMWIAHAWSKAGRAELSERAIGSILDYYGTSPQRERMIRGERPHIKIDGDRVADMSAEWLKKRSSASQEAMHAQNDSLGLLLWQSFSAASSGAIDLSPERQKSLGLLVSYLDRIGYEKDLECGVWEEEHRSGGRVLASSLRAILAGLEALRDWADADPPRWQQLERMVRDELGQDAPPLDRDRVLTLLDRGRSAIREILPYESRGEGLKERRDDLALLVVLYLDLLAAPADRVLDDAGRREILGSIERLEGTHGHRRYEQDGYWAAYENEKDLDDRKRLMKGRPDERAERGIVPHSEAQWTLASPWLSAICGLMHRESGDPKYAELQTAELNRALGMVTGPKSSLGPGRLPESYMLVRETDPRAKGVKRWRYRENPLPLNWSKANLLLALSMMA